MTAITDDQFASLALQVLTAPPAAQSKLASRYNVLRNGSAAYEAARVAAAQIESDAVRSVIGALCCWCPMLCGARPSD